MKKTLSPFGELLSTVMPQDTDKVVLAGWCDTTVETVSSWMTDEIEMPSEKALEGLSLLTKMSPAKLRGIVASSNESVRELDEAFAKPLSQG